MKIEKSFMNNDESSLQQVNKHVLDSVQSITNQLVAEGYEIIFSGADGIICKKKNFEVQPLFHLVKNCSKEISFSMGVSPSLCDAFLALRYAKSNGKDTAAIHNLGFSLIR
ncbi:mCpol domain-containing protein [Paenibacillus terrae]|uniref:Minimal CRISPR polymerase domain-containing protein n=1 Tax=Paenibacillus terrae TaxID=159743 RepID=A0A0D7WXG3_9BACL|nr:mCpol domain-containing protein [Paenibacillus terrae]KJD43876.1 hypothetical protein QD47_20350 [Paenibacillus terrae]